MQPQQPMAPAALAAAAEAAPAVPTAAAAPAAHFRSGAVARMAGMPVATLRIWEQRYQAVGPVTAPSGHRLYSAAEVERVVLLRQLTEQGHAIGPLAGLGTDQLRHMRPLPSAATAEGGGSPVLPTTPPPVFLRVVVVGRAMAEKLQRPGLRHQWVSQPLMVGVFDSLAEATQAATAAAGTVVDLLLWQTPSLTVGVVAELTAAQTAWQAAQAAVAYRFSSAAARAAVAAAGAHVAHEPADDAALCAWLSTVVKRGGAHAQLPPTHGQATAATPLPLATASVVGLFQGPVPARRFDDAALTAFASLPASIACECPTHVAELLMQIASFEAYSATCASRSPADADMHAHLQRVAGIARLLFESALERIAIAEGHWLPPQASNPHFQQGH